VLRQHLKAGETNFLGDARDNITTRVGAREIARQNVPHDLLDGLSEHSRCVEADSGDVEFFGHGGGPAEEEVGNKAAEARSSEGAAHFSSQIPLEEAVEGFLQALVASE
jgi:hypothetical protein